MRTLTWNKSTGPKPSKEALNAAQSLAREGSADAMAIAMLMRPNGATQPEIITLLGAPHRNKVRELISKRRVKKSVIPDNSRAIRIRLVKR
jgi:hypothetical protein